MKAICSSVVAVALSATVSVSRVEASYDYWDLNVTLAKDSATNVTLAKSGISVTLGAAAPKSVTAGLFKVTPTGDDAGKTYDDNAAAHPRTDGFVSPDLGPMPTGPDTFYSFCTDFNVFMASGDFDPTPFAGQNGVAPDWVAGGIQRAAWLYNNIWLGTFQGTIAGLLSGSGGNVMAAQANAAALQLAVWNVLYDTDTTLGGGVFKATAGANVLNAADAFLTQLAGAGPITYATTWLQPMDTATGKERGNQGLLYQPVSVPDGGATAMLLGLGLIGTAYLRRGQLAPSRG